MTDARQYSAYLAKRSIFGFFYRRLILYPTLCKYLNGDVLDVGCGIGDMLKYRPSTVGLDVNPFNVDVCKRKGLSAKVMEPDLIPFSNQSFDCILLDNVLEHIPNPEKLLNEIDRALRPDGCLLVGVPGTKGYISDSDHKVFYDEEALLCLAERYGFKVQRLFYMPLFKSSWLSQRLKQYCIYSVWVKG